MNNKKSLKERIVQSVYLYETKRITFETINKMLILLASLSILIVFGGVIFDIYSENELGDLIGNLEASGEYTLTKIKEMGMVFFNEIPQWVFIVYIFGLLLGCILAISIIRNWSKVSHRVRSLVVYWFKI